MDTGPADPPHGAASRDVVAAWRLVLGRNPDNAAAIAPALGRPPLQVAEALARTVEFRALLARLAEDRLPPHADLPAAALDAALRWGAAQGVLAGEPPAGLAAGIAALLGTAPARAAAALLPDAQRDRLAALRADPAGSLLGRLDTPATAEDADRLGLLLTGTALPPPPDASTLLGLIRAVLAAEPLRPALLRPLAEGRLPAAADPPREVARAVAAWLAARLGLPQLPEGATAAPLAAFLGLAPVRDLLARAAPAEAAPVLALLPALASGAYRLGRLPGAPLDATHAYLALLGRPPESPAIEAAAQGGTLGGQVFPLLASAEFRTQVLGRLAGGEQPPHATLSPAERQQAATWLVARLGAAEAPPAFRSHPASLLQRLFALPALAEAGERQHGALWHDAAAAIAAWRDEAEHGAAGAIDYVTGDVIAGWALDRRQPGRPLDVEILCNGALVGFGRADRPRPGAEPGLEGCGFRIPWHGRSMLRPAEDVRFRIHRRDTGTPVGAAFPLDAVFVAARSTLQMLAEEVAALRAQVARLEAMLPQVESFAAFAPEHYDAFRRLHRTAPPPPGTPHQLLHLVLDGDGVTVRGLRRTLDSLAAQGWAHWRATVLAEGAGQRALAGLAAARDGRIALLPAGTDPAQAARAAAADGMAALVLLVPPGAVLAEAALAWFAHAAAALPGARGFFCDEDALLDAGRDRDRHAAPVFRTALDHWELPLRNPCGALLCARREALGPALDAPALAAGRDPGLRRRCAHHRHHPDAQRRRPARGCGRIAPRPGGPARGAGPAGRGQWQRRAGDARLAGGAAARGRDRPAARGRALQLVAAERAGGGTGAGRGAAVPERRHAHADRRMGPHPAPPAGGARCRRRRRKAGLRGPDPAACRRRLRHRGAGGA